MEQIYKQYIADLKSKKKKDKDGLFKPANPWATNKPDSFWSDCWNKIEQSGLKFDGKHITIDERGVNYDYVAYKNKMLLVYPESRIDIELVYKGDSFAYSKDNGVVDYKHIIGDPFNHKDVDIVGGYCVIKNKRGEFITVLSKAEIEKAKKVAKTTKIWDDWYAEMCKKTVIKKAVKFHFDDIYTAMEEEDNKNYDLEKTDEPELSEALKNAVLEADSMKALTVIYNREYDRLETPALKAEFISLCTARKKEFKQ